MTLTEEVLLERLFEDETAVKCVEAAEKGNIEEVRECLCSGVDPDIKGHKGWTLLRVAVYHDQFEIAELLLKSGALVDATSMTGQTALMVASAHGRTLTAKLLLEHGADPNKADIDGWTSLMRASENGCRDCVEMLLEHGADPISRTNAEIRRSCMRPKQATRISSTFSSEKEPEQERKTP